MSLINDALKKAQAQQAAQRAAGQNPPASGSSTPPHGDEDGGSAQQARSVIRLKQMGPLPNTPVPGLEPSPPAQPADASATPLPIPVGKQVTQPPFSQRPAQPASASTPSTLPTSSMAGSEALAKALSRAPFPAREPAPAKQPVTPAAAPSSAHPAGGSSPVFGHIPPAPLNQSAPKGLIKMMLVIGGLALLILVAIVVMVVVMFKQKPAIDEVIAANSSVSTPATTSNLPADVMQTETVEPTEGTDSRLPTVATTPAPDTATEGTFTAELPPSTPPPVVFDQPQGEDSAENGPDTAPVNTPAAVPVVTESTPSETTSLGSMPKQLIDRAKGVADRASKQNDVIGNEILGDQNPPPPATPPSPPATPPVVLQESPAIPVSTPAVEPVTPPVTSTPAAVTVTPVTATVGGEPVTAVQIIAHVTTESGPKTAIPNPDIVAYVNTLEVRGFMGGGRRVLIYDPETKKAKPVTKGSMVNPEYQLMYKDVTDTEVIFEDTAGAIYVKYR